MSMSFADRQKRHATIPAGFTEREGSRHRTRAFECRAVAEFALFTGPVRVVEPGALVVGTHQKKILVTDPGELVEFSPGSVENLDDRFVVAFAMTYHADELRTGSMSNGTLMSEGAWPALFTSYRAEHASTPLTARAALDAFKAASGAGFSADDIEEAFAGLPGVVGIVRDAVREAVLSHVKGLTGRQAALWFYRVAELKLVNGFLEADLGPLVREVFTEELTRNTAEAGLTELLDLVETLTTLEV